MAVGGLVMAGCASPGPPKPPSLGLPQVVRDVSAEREGDAVRVRFTLPQRTTDGLSIREATVRGALCRGAEGAPCVPVAALSDVAVRVVEGASAAERVVTWMDRLPASETAGPARLLLYRVELKNEAGRSAGWSEPAYTAAGAAPSAVEELRAEETREGILLEWKADVEDAEVIVRREVVATPASKDRSPGTPVFAPASKDRSPGTPVGAAGSEDRGASGRRKGAKAEEPVWLASHAGSAGSSGVSETLDATAEEDTAYRYVAVRRRVEQIGARKVEVRSAASNAVVIAWRNLFPPRAPAGLSAAPFAEGGQFAVDLVWEPVEEPGLKGYVVTRQVVDASGAAVGEAERLGRVELPAFHDAAAKQGVRYRYEVRAVSAKEVEGAAAMVVVEP